MAMIPLVGGGGSDELYGGAGNDLLSTEGAGEAIEPTLTPLRFMIAKLIPQTTLRKPLLTLTPTLKLLVIVLNILVLIEQQHFLTN
jgi:hypothetical protein